MWLDFRVFRPVNVFIVRLLIRLKAFRHMVDAFISSPHHLFGWCLISLSELDSCSWYHDIQLCVMYIVQFARNNVFCYIRMVFELILQGFTLAEWFENEKCGFFSQTKASLVQLNRLQTGKRKVTMFCLPNQFSNLVRNWAAFHFQVIGKYSFKFKVKPNLWNIIQIVAYYFCSKMFCTEQIKWVVHDISAASAVQNRNVVVKT